MSTKSSIYYAPRIHIYQEMLDMTLHFEYTNKDVIIDIEIPKEAVDELGQFIMKQCKDLEKECNET